MNDLGLTISSTVQRLPGTCVMSISKITANIYKKSYSVFPFYSGRFGCSAFCLKDEGVSVVIRVPMEKHRPCEDGVFVSSRPCHCQLQKDVTMHDKGNIGLKYILHGANCR